MVTTYATLLAPSVGLFGWHFCYLHGEAENVMSMHSDDAPDCFSADMPMPAEAGNYLVSLYGEPALAVIATRHGMLNGRIALLSDSEALAHVVDVEAWA